MAYRCGERRQSVLFPSSIEDYVAKNSPVRAYDAVIDSLDVKDLGLRVDSNAQGAPSYCPVTMLKLLCFAYSYGIRSSRKIEREVHNNLSFIWLMGGLKPDHKTIAEFRRKNKGVLQKVLKQVARICVELELIEGNTLFVDGSKFRANACLKNRWTRKNCEKYLKKLDNRISRILAESEKVDEEEDKEGSYAKMREELSNTEILKERVEKIARKLKEEHRETLNTVDSDCVRISGRQGSHAGYNAQLAVDEKHGLVISADVVAENNDLQQLSKQLSNANKQLNMRYKTVCADAGYSNIEELEKIHQTGTRIVVPSVRQASKKPSGKHRDDFCYDAKRDCYLCPQGYELHYSHTQKKGHSKIYRMKDRSRCKACKLFGSCTKSKTGREMSRLVQEELREEIEQQFEAKEAQEIFKLRKQKVEHPFGHFKRNLGVDAFLLRGLQGVKAEMALLGSCFNIRRMISLFGVCDLTQALRTTK